VPKIFVNRQYSSKTCSHVFGGHSVYLRVPVLCTSIIYVSFARNSRQRISGDARQHAVCEQAFSLYNTCPNRGHHHGMLLQPSAMKFAVCQLLYATSWNICFDLASLWRISAETSIAVIHTLCHTATKVMGQPSDMTETTAYLLCVDMCT